MFTVVIAEKKFINKYEQYKTFLSPMLDKDKFAFCYWDREGENLEEMLPDLYELIQYKNDWKAVILNQDGLNELNPFNYTKFVDDYVVKRNPDWQKIKERRKVRFEAYEKAANNPLTKLTSALCGTPVFDLTVQDENTYSEIVAGNKELYEYMLELQLDAVNTLEAANNLKNYKLNAVKHIVPESKVDYFIECVKSKNTKEIISLVSEDGIVDAINLIGDNDPRYSDPEYVEWIVDSTKRLNLFNELANNFSLKDKLPTDVICVAPRTFDTESYNINMNWQDKDECEYTTFTNRNLFNGNLKFILFDMLPKDHKQYHFDELKLCCLLLLLATNGIEQGVVAGGKIYNADLIISTDAIRDVCLNYISKLKATKTLINEVKKDIAEEESKPLDNEESRKLFEADIKIPVEINSDFDKNQLMAKYDTIGLSKDCPTDEYHFWYNQSRSISKLFVRYLREPRRAVKKAATVDLRANSTIDDERILRMTENQLEDIEFRLQEEEQAMIETTTARIYETASCKKEIDEADKELRRKIGQRMTRKTTIIASLIAIAAYFLGFIPVLFSNLNNTTSSVFSLYFTLGAVGIFALIGFVCLIVLRKQLKDRFKHFNYVMSGVLNDIDNSLHAFSRYFSRMCNVMRAFFVMDYSKNTLSPRQKALKKHESDINKQIDEVMRLFANYVDGQVAIPTDCEPYNYDFTVMGKYDYEMPYPCFDEEIEYMQAGNKIKVPVNFIKAVTLTREELYD